MQCSKTPIIQCRNLGPVSAKQLANYGIKTLGELIETGAIEIFVSIAEKSNKQPSFNLLYAMLGAIENKHWTEYKKQKGELALIVESQLELRQLQKKNSCF
ncbi:hypothetical protein FLL45_14815 [Aliikangiella marina]|uniref:TfoX C-terminal domain-containing protein n=1 Tax=Aliikangiella marina TaxID=1712262 RepID=A0A545TA87_9GAMM|nr:TfoX/Sxy family DNA transformation protein [Aliikangiella marina]TQV74126.1 hypothetical protein FLL45_14815 [Aliikangiella marina]